ncbi:RNA-binding (RRM/RBD/RNP motifs) family protein [Wolffia australiana]
MTDVQLKSEQEVSGDEQEGPINGGSDESDGNEGPAEEAADMVKRKNELKKKKKKQRKRGSSEDYSKRGICYISRIPPNMDPASLRHMLSQYGEIDRIYLSPTGPDPTTATQGRRRRTGGARGQAFSEGWVEFVKKSVAKSVANMLNGEQMGGRRRSSFFYDIWNIKYLRKFKWDDLTGEIAHKNAVREKKMALEIAAAKRERNYTLSKYAHSRALSAIEERLKKKRKIADVESSGDGKIYRQFSQNQPLDDGNRKGKLSKDVLAGVFGNISA